MAQKVGPRCMIQQTDNSITVEVRGGTTDDLDSVVQAARSEFDRVEEDFVSVRNHEVVTLEKDNDGTWR